MLPAESRMRRRADFAVAVRRGSRAGRRLLTGHLLVRGDDGDQPPRVGFVVSKAVGKAVVRNKVRGGCARSPAVTCHRCREVACLWYGLIHRLRPHARQISPPNWTW